MLIRTRIPASECIPDALAAQALELTAAQRRCSRQRILLDGVELGIALPPGTTLEPGDQLLADDGRRFEVCAAPETVLRISADDATTQARAAYHLGNRHVAVEVGDGYLAIEPDPVLEAMLLQIGVRCEHAQWPFQPETGAYGGGHRHGHDATFADDHRLAQSLFAHHHDHPHPHPHPDGGDGDSACVGAA
ncbi:MAG: urease accessory protein UreE [Rhodanobacteraceae bacterium]|nr:urease accessory protein UreE [Rhodanobacteraceae bacterium]